MADDVAAGDRSQRRASPAMTTLGPELDAARARVVARGLTVKAFAQLTPVVTGLGLSLEALGPVKQLQKRFFSDVPRLSDDDGESPTCPRAPFKHSRSSKVRTSRSPHTSSPSGCS